MTFLRRVRGAPVCLSCKFQLSRLIRKETEKSVTRGGAPTGDPSRLALPHGASALELRLGVRRGPAAVLQPGEKRASRALPARATLESRLWVEHRV